MRITLGDRLIEPGTKLFHASRNLDKLVSDGRFDPAHSEYGGAMFFTVEPAIRSNCVATVGQQLMLAAVEVDMKAPGSALVISPSNGNWRKLAEWGYDGKMYPNSEDPYTEVEPGGVYCDEIVIVGSSLEKLLDIRSLRAVSLQPNPS